MSYIIYLQGLEHGDDSKWPEAADKSEDRAIDLTHGRITMHVAQARGVA